MVKNKIFYAVALIVVLSVMLCVNSFIAFASSDTVNMPEVSDITGKELNDYKSELFSESNFTFKGYTLNYRYYEPANDNKDYPLIICLHGMGERGDDNDSQLNNVFLRPFIEDKNSKFYKAMVVAPQCPVKENGNGWVNLFKEENGRFENYNIDEVEESVECKTIVALIEDICNTYDVDRDRIYLIGLSQGAMATWDLLARHSDLFAAAVPIAGVGDVSKAEIYAEIPIYAFHGKNDVLVPYEKATPKLYEAIKATGKNNMHFVTFTDGYHDVWEAAIVFKGTENVPAFEDWLFSQTKGKEEKSGCGSSINLSELSLVVAAGIICAGAYIGLGRRRAK